MSEEELIKYIKGLTEITKENNKRGIEVGVEISVDMAEQLLSLIEKQQNKIKNVKTRLEYYLMGNMSFNKEAQEEFKKLFKILEE